MSKRSHKSPRRSVSHKNKAQSSNKRKSIDHAPPPHIYAGFFSEDLSELERTADRDSKVNELSECIEFVSQLVDLFKHTVIIPELQSAFDWHDDIADAIKRNKGATGNAVLDDRVEEIVASKGLSKEQWQRLLALNFAAGDTLDMTHVTRKHLRKVHDMVGRLLEGEEQATAKALIDALEKYMSRNYFTNY